IQNHFEQIATNLDLGFSLTFFNKISQNPSRYKKGFALCVIVCGILVFLIASYIGLVESFGLNSYFWPDVTSSWVWAGALFGIVTYVSRIVISITDAAGVAKITELMRSLRVVAVLATLAALFFLKALSILSVLLTLGLSLLIFSVFCLRYGHKMMGG